MDAPYRAYVKDCLNLTAAPKIFMTVKDGSPAGDILTSSSSSFTCLDDVPEEVREGDVFCLYGPSGNTIYTGVIESKGKKQLQTKQIYSLFDMEWFTRVFKQDHLEHEIADVFNDFMAGKIGEVVTTLPDANQDNFAKNMNYYRHNGNDYEEYRISKNFDDENKKYVYSTDKIRIVSQIVTSLPAANEENYAKDTTYYILSGDKYTKHKIKRTYNESTFDYDYTMENIGEIASSDIDSDAIPPLTDSMMVQKYSAFSVSYSDSQELHLTSDDDQGTLRNMEDFIYSLYEDYGVVVEIEIPYSGQCYFRIKTANYSGTKIAKNSANIISISPEAKTEETNKLIIMSSIGAYRKTYYATTNGITDDASDANRLPVINVEVVYSDDELDDIKAEHLKDEMYNHELVFDMLLNNKIYDFYSWHLGQPLEVYYKGVYYKTVFTGYSYSFSEGERASVVEITCGKVRERLTDIINRKII